MYIKHSNTLLQILLQSFTMTPLKHYQKQAKRNQELKLHLNTNKSEVC